MVGQPLEINGIFFAYIKHGLYLCQIEIMHEAESKGVIIGRFMRKKFTISITDVTGSKHYEFNKIVKIITIYSLVVIAILIPASIFTIAHLNRNINSLEKKKNFIINDIASKYAFAMEENSNLRKEKEAMSKEFKEIDQKIKFIEKFIEVKPSQGLSLVERLDAASLAFERREETFKEIAHKIENIEGMIGLKMSGNANIMQRVNLVNMAAMQRRMMLDSIPNGYPIDSQEITSKYGVRIHPILKEREFHKGVDLRTKMNTPVRAVADGVVSFAGFHKKKGGFGRLVAIRHNFAFSTSYGHLNKLLVKTGEFVKKGQIVALTGNSGVSNGPHLHFEIRYIGNSLDPEPFMEWGIYNFELIFRKVKRVKWQSLINLINQRLMERPRQLLQLALG